MHLRVFIVLALTALAAAQQSDSSTPIFVMPMSQDPSTLPSESDPSSFPQFDQGSATDGSASTNMPSGNFNSDRPATDDFSSFSSFPQQQQSQTGDMPSATSQQPVLSTNLLMFPSVPLSVPTTAFQDTSNALTGPAAPAIQQDGTADPTGIPAVSTLQTGMPASASALFTAQAGILASTVQLTAVPATGTQPAAIESTPLSMLPTSFATTPFQAPQAMAPTTAPIVFQTTPLPTVIPSTSYPPSQPPSAALPTVFTVFPTTPFPTKQTSAGPPPEVPTHIQIIFNNSYTNIVPDSINMADFTRGLASSLAALLQVPLYRISNVTVLSQPQTGFLVLRFVVLPSITTVSTSPATSVTAFVPVDAIEVVVNQLRDLVLSIGSTFQLASQNSTVLTVNRQSNDQIFASWTESGPCPKTPCGSSGSCVCSLTGTLQCQSPSQSSILFPASAANLLLLLLLLLLIPLVIFLVLVVIRVRRRKPHQKKQQQQPEKRVVRADMLSYHEYVAREKDPQQPKIATIASRSTINHSTLNSLHKYLGENISIAYNGASFLDNMAVDNADSTSRDAILPNGN